ncbi:MAG: phosphatase PAP2 family protein [Pelotomaculum sp.]|uniref:Membrane-associated phospholipid phosphatase n=1 Tax=Pelotomaculum thermopropionicum (strain DSM 13744 / JCM 10971 / SI) TaxID=370438 RepID=A5D0T1_PELTS|nr:phosphatase PAP2 family protein [Pelotomaculum sp.]BAF60153.1 membrane-associated phospholipid phosphatase [Pelotomaculum thermopropionicum SI]
MRLDAGLFNQINHGLHNSFFDFIMPLISRAGEGGLIWIVFGLAMFFSGRPVVKRAALLMLAALLVSYLAGEEGLKHLFRRPRPFETLPGVDLLVPPPHSFSFPSGHAANAFASGLVLARKIPALALPALSLAVVMSFSRVYVGVHYPLDVVGGALLGAACALLVLKGEAAVLHVPEKTKPPFMS